MISREQAEQEAAAAVAEMQQMMLEANELTGFLMKRLERFKPSADPQAKTIDARVVAISCAQVAGVYLSMIQDPVIRLHYRDNFPKLFQKIMDTPTMQPPPKGPKQ